MDDMADKSAPQKKPSPKRNTLTLILKTPDDVAIKNRLEVALAQGKLDGKYSQEMTLSEFSLLLLNAQMAAGKAVRKSSK